MPINTRSWLGVEIPDNLKLTVERKQKNTWGRFQAISPFSTKARKEKYDLLENFTQLTPAAQRLFVEINLHRDGDTNLVCYPLPFENRTDSAYKLHSRALSKLKSQQFVKQLKNEDVQKLNLCYSSVPCQHFIINPHFIRCTSFNTAKLMWRKM